MPQTRRNADFPVRRVFAGRYPHPPSPLSNGIMGLADIFTSVFESKGLTYKVFQTKGLMLSKSAENGFGAASRGVFVDGRASKLPQSEFYCRTRRGFKSINFVAAGIQNPRPFGSAQGRLCRKNATRTGHPRKLRWVKVWAGPHSIMGSQ